MLDAGGQVVVVVGSVNVDLQMTMTALPAPGETVGEAAFSQGIGGKGANVAVAAARLGARTALAGCVGDDRHGEQARAALVAAGVDCAELVTVSAVTGVAVVLTEDGGENSIAIAPGANASLDGTRAAAAVRALVRTRSTATSAIGAAAPGAPSAVVVANLEVGDDAVLAAARAAREAGARFVLDPAPARTLPDELLALTDVLVPNGGELRRLDPNGGDALLAAGTGAIVRTDGSAGAVLLLRDAEPQWIPPFSVDARDGTGAGDAFCAALSVALLDGASLRDAARHGAAAGALATRAVGAQASLPARAELEALLAHAAG